MCIPITCVLYTHIQNTFSPAKNTTQGNVFAKSAGAKNNAMLLTDFISIGCFFSLRNWWLCDSILGLSLGDEMFCLLGGGYMACDCCLAHLHVNDISDPRSHIIRQNFLELSRKRSLIMRPVWKRMSFSAEVICSKWNHNELRWMVGKHMCNAFQFP